MYGFFSSMKVTYVTSSFREEAPVCNIGVFLVIQIAYAISFHAVHLCDVFMRGL